MVIGSRGISGCENNSDTDYAMTTEEKKAIEERLREANRIEEQIKVFKDSLDIIDSGALYLNACTFQREHEMVSRAIELSQFSIRDVFKSKIEELTKEWENL